MQSKAKIILVSCISLALGYSLAFVGIKTTKTKLQKVADIVATDYVDSLKYEELENEIINDFLDDLDPHSLYLLPKKADGARQSLAGNYKGYGFIHKPLKGRMFVLKVIKNSPADKVGLKVGDFIEKVENLTVDTFENNYQKAFDYLKNTEINKASLKVLRFASNKKVVLHLTKEKVIVPMVEQSMLNAKTGYVKLVVFGTESHMKLKESLKNLKAKGASQFILDLRNNGGGLVNEATNIINEFISLNNILLAYTDGKAYDRKNYYSNGNGNFTKEKLIILVNKNSASASEITSGSLQDLDRALIIGDVSFGKGLVQKTFDFNDKSQLRLTIARYYLPSGRCIQKPYDGFFKKMKKDTFFSKNNHLLLSNGGITPNIVIDDTINCINLNNAIEYVVVNQLKNNISEQNAQQFLNKHNCESSNNLALIYLNAAQLILKGKIKEGEKLSLINDVYIETALKQFKQNALFNP